ncbi:MAG: hypothetical protein KGI75_29340 [Rhizobiaceae bacterium]|nr:hypothetical protein [Rhizobiaceae bacterium]
MRCLSILIAALLVSILAAHAQPERIMEIARQYGAGSALAANCPNLTLDQQKLEAFFDAEGVYRADLTEGTPFRAQADASAKETLARLSSLAQPGKKNRKQVETRACNMLLDVIHANGSLLKGLLAPK